LKEGGKLRISTPDLKFLLDLYTPYKSEIQQSYIKWATDNHINGAPSYTDTIVINNYFRDWGHLFIYDFTVLKETLESIGFKEIKRQFINKSNDPELADLENESRMPPGFLELESLIVEAVK
jgi:predicted SAM-dependent methyltransferase